MKRILSVCVFLLLIVSVAVATDEDILKVSHLISDNFKKNYGEIISLSASLENQDRAFLYASFAKEPTVPFVINMLGGFGIGSYIQGDTTGGTIGLVGELGSIAAGIGGFFLMLGSGAFVDIDNPDPPPLRMGMLGGGMTLFYGGIAAWIGFRLFECIRPFSYANNYNKMLRGMLYGVPVLSVVPVVPSMDLNDMGMAVVAKVSF